MMSASVKLKTVGCSVVDIFPSGSPIVAELSRFNSDKYVVFPGFCDVHVHFREPGFSYKETIETGSRAAARGGYSAVCTMPNLNPVPDNREHLQMQLDLIRENAVIHTIPMVRFQLENKAKNWLN